MSLAMQEGAPAAQMTQKIIRRSGRGWLARVGDINVLKVAGSPYDMGYQHGVLLADDIRRGPIPYFRAMVEKLIGKGALGPLSGLVYPALQTTIGRRVARRLPDFAVESLHGIADGAGLDRQTFIDGCTMPDSIMWVAARMMQFRGGGPATAHRIALELGCTSAVAWGDATQDGALLHARNFDYHGVGNWPQTKTVIFHEPDEGHRYLSVAAAGVALGGVTAMNSAGLSLTVHQHMFTDKTRLGGMPIGLVGDEIMRTASSLDEAQEILESHTPIGCWTYVITDGNTRQVLCHEENPDRDAPMRLGESESTFGYANIYLDPELGKTEKNLYGSYWRHNRGRHRRVNELLDEQSGRLDPQRMANILGDTGSPDCRVRDSIAMVMTVGSVVFRPEDGTVWVGTGDSPTSHGRFIPFSLAQEGYAPERGTLEVTADGEEAFECFRKTYVAYVDREDIDAARGHMEEACRLAPEQSLYHGLLGLLALTAADGVAAERSFDEALKLGHHDPERLASLHLWRGRARDLQGRRDDAEKDYRWSLGHYADAPVHRAARRGLRRRFTPKHARKVHIDIAFADVVMP
ncbi:MAG TPA: hypothetical protein ENK57_00090 [Polyangiaceae bacterium]|nr:hypothetical protein [Polyangiaceae bacterium]